MLVLSLFAPLFPRDQILQHVPTVIALIGLTFAARRRVFSDPAFTCIVFFLWLHILGARYVYSNVPYDVWSQRLWGTPLSDWFGWDRNHYDRLVHLLFGVLAVPPSLELLCRDGKLSRSRGCVFAVSLVLAVSALYEIFEWLLTVFMAPASAETYNGQQGDLWDAQKDMALAGLGALFVALWQALRRRKPSGLAA